MTNDDEEKFNEEINLQNYMMIALTQMRLIRQFDEYDENKLLLQLHDFPSPKSIDQALAQGATHNKYLQRIGQRTQPQ